MSDYLETRPWQPDDLVHLRASEFLFALESYPRRFLAGHRRLRPLHLKVSTQLAEPGRRWMGQIALYGNQVIALAECAWNPDERDSPTLAVNVAQAWQDSGLDGRVLRELVTRGVDLGITTFNLDYAASSATLQSMVDSVSGRTGTRFHQSSVTRAGMGLVTVRAAK